MIIATVSLLQIWENKNKNLLLIEEYINEASHQNVDVIIFPEMTLTGFSTNIELISENENTSNTIYKLKQFAIKFNIAIVFGMVIDDNEKSLNQCLFMDKDGEILGKYSKIHPFSFSGEEKYFNSGTKLQIVDFLNVKIGLTICYDLRFPELYSSLAKSSDIIINIANWPKVRIDHWNTLLKSRAIENQLFIIGVNRTGIGNNLQYEESSNVFNSNGELLNYSTFNDMKIYMIDKDFTKKFKNIFNTTNDRKIELYKELM